MDTEIKEELSYAYLYSIASIAGYSVDRPHRDNDSIDTNVSVKGKVTSESIKHSAKLDIQLKSTSVTELTDPIKFYLPFKNYNDMICERAVPIILILYVLPRDNLQWVEHTEEELITRKCGYWYSLKGLPEIALTEEQDPSTHKVKIEIPKANVFCPSILKGMLNKISKGEELTNDVRDY